MKKIGVSVVLIILISHISLAHELEPGKLWINNILISYEKSDFDDVFSDLEGSFEEEVKSTFYIYANGQRIAKKENNKLYYFYNDHLGSPRAISDENGDVIWEADYLPFGEVFNEQGKNNVKYNSKELDLDTKLHYYGQRYYLDDIGRFITADTIEMYPNAYVYVSNNPMNLVDPSGNQLKRVSGVEEEVPKDLAKPLTPEQIDRLVEEKMKEYTSPALKKVAGFIEKFTPAGSIWEMSEAEKRGEYGKALGHALQAGGEMALTLAGIGGGGAKYAKYVKESVKESQKLRIVNVPELVGKIETGEILTGTRAVRLSKARQITALEQVGRAAKAEMQVELKAFIKELPTYAKSAGEEVASDALIAQQRWIRVATKDIDDAIKTFKSLK